MTGHNLLASHASRMGISNDVTSRKCKELDMRETLEDVLRLCTILSRTHHKYIGASQLKGLVKYKKYQVALKVRRKPSRAV